MDVLSSILIGFSLEPGRGAFFDMGVFGWHRVHQKSFLSSRCSLMRQNRWRQRGRGRGGEEESGR
jgi:hypothetical protein